MSKTPLFIVFEGPDGSGTSTQIEILHDRLSREGHDVVKTREPGGTCIGEEIRELILSPEFSNLDNVAELLFFSAIRRQHIVELIQPSLNAGKPVLSDRYVASSYAYQESGRGTPKDFVTSINYIAIQGLFPDFTIFFDLPFEQANERQGNRDREKDRLELEGRGLQERVRSRYLELAASDPDSVLIDASRSIEKVGEEVWNTLTKKYPCFPFKEK